MVIFRKKTETPSLSLWAEFRWGTRLMVREAEYPESLFQHFRSQDGTWVSGCLVCYTVVGSAESFEQLAEMEANHRCSENRRLNYSELLLLISRHVAV